MDEAKYVIFLNCASQHFQNIDVESKKKNLLIAGAIPPTELGPGI